MGAAKGKQLVFVKLLAIHNGGSQGEFCYLDVISFWLRDVFPYDQHICRHIMVAHLEGCLHEAGEIPNDLVILEGRRASE